MFSGSIWNDVEGVYKKMQLVTWLWLDECEEATTESATLIPRATQTPTYFVTRYSEQRQSGKSRRAGKAQHLRSKFQPLDRLSSALTESTQQSPRFGQAAGSGNFLPRE
jgi:hypothetical protein